MIKNYFKTAWRNLWKNKFYMILNLTGLGFAMACCIVTFLNFDYKLRFDEHHEEHAPDLYRINSVWNLDGYDEPWGLTPVALGMALSDDSEIASVVRLYDTQAIVKVGDKAFSERIHYSDTDLLKIFNFPLKYGSVPLKTDIDKIILSEELAKKYFGEGNPLGKELIIIDRMKREKTFYVGGVTDKIPENTSILFDALLPVRQLFDPVKFPENSWKFNTHITTFIKLTQGQDPTQVSRKLEAYATVFNEAQEGDIRVQRFYLQPFREIAFTSDIDLPGYVKGRALNRNAVGFLVVITVVISLIIMVTACFNFANVSIAISNQRLKEIGLRKVVGGTRKQLIRQFIFENMLLCGLGVLIGFLIAPYLISGFNSLFDQHLDMRYLFRPRVLFFLLILPLATALVAGLYPAVYLSSHKPVNILKGSAKFMDIGWLGKTLLVSQFSLSAMTILIGVILIQNSLFQDKVDFGFDMKRLLFVKIDDPGEYDVFYHALRQNPDVEAIAGSANLVNQTDDVQVMVQDSHTSLNTKRLLIGPDYLKTMGIDLLSGGEFNKAGHNDGVIINQQLEDRLAAEDILGSSILVDGQPHTVIGITGNYREQGLVGVVHPTVFQFTPESSCNFIMVNADPERLHEVYQYTQNIWYKLSPDQPFEGGYMETQFYKQFMINDMLRNINLFLAAVTLLLSVSGFFAMASLRLKKQAKEISIRKVFGATIHQMIRMVSLSLLKFLLIAFILGGTIGFIIINNLLFKEVYSEHVAVGSGSFLISFLILLSVPALVVGFRVFKSASANPAEIMRCQ